MSDLYLALLHVDGEFVYDSLPERGQQSEPIQSVLALLEDDDVVVESWIDGAVELRLDDDVELGWAYHGSLRGAAALFERAADDARE